MSYNYSRFRTSFYDLATFDGPRVGEAMPDFELTTIDGSPIRLSELLDRPLVLETGSVTCPMYAKGVEAMQELAARHPEVRFAVLYVREAHPGGRVGPHQSVSEKRLRAASLADVHDDHRLVLVDDLDGTAHRSLGLLPDSVYIVGTDGQVRFRGDWADPAAVETVLAARDAAIDLPEHFPPAKPAPPLAIRTLLVGGLAAVWDFLVGLPGLIRLHRTADQAYERHEPSTGRQRTESV
ncbi:MAG: redoxin domain-containing protein [Acidimicrobiia bacterium]|nr:redoxin domain-containing protein [Acidimicrobiia bacterium]